MDINITLIGQMITFSIFVGFTMKFVWPPLRRALDERREKIAEGLSAADRASRELEIAKKKAGEVLHDAKSKATEILENAYMRASNFAEQVKEESSANAEKIKIIAMDEIKQEKIKAREELKRELVNLIMAGASKVISAEVDQKVSNKILKDFLEKV